MSMILVIDDDNAVLRLFKIILDGLGYNAEFFLDPVKACERLKSSNFGDFGLILTDYYMPGMNGLELTRRVREMPRFDRMPILVVTGQDVSLVEADLLAAKATQVSVKPFTTRALEAALKNFGNIKPYSK